VTNRSRSSRCRAPVEQVSESGAGTDGAQNSTRQHLEALVRYLALVSITDAEFARVRATAAYQLALWSMRLQFLGVLAWIWLQVFVSSAPTWQRGTTFVSVFVLGFVSAFALHRAGYPVFRMRTKQPENRRISWLVYRDVVLLWRRPSIPR
jgi:hypothetical protein